MNCATPVVDGLEPYEVSFGGPENNQPQYVALHALRSPDGRVMSRWEPTPEEREMIARGADIFVTIWTGGAAYPPTLVQVLNRDGCADALREEMRLDDDLTLRMLHDDLQTTLKIFEEKKAALVAKQQEVLRRMGAISGAAEGTAQQQGEGG